MQAVRSADAVTSSAGKFRAGWSCAADASSSRRTVKRSASVYGIASWIVSVVSRCPCVMPLEEGAPTWPEIQGQKFIRRNRAASRAHHLRGSVQRRAEDRAALRDGRDGRSLGQHIRQSRSPRSAERKFLEFDMDNFDSRMAAIEPGVTFTCRQQARRRRAARSCRSTCSFKKMDDFSPAAVARQVPGDRQAAGGARAARQSAALHGRQGRGRGPAQEAAGRSAS